jgi:tetratricopeptide (TPR) repeat protein
VPAAVRGPNVVQSGNYDGRSASTAGVGGKIFIMDGEAFRMRWPARVRDLQPTWSTLLMAVGVVALLGLLATGAWLWHGAQVERGSAAYGAALMRARPAESPDAPPEARTTATADLERALADYPSHPMAPQAAYSLGNVRFALGQYDKARAAWQIAAAKAGSGTIATLARAGIGYAWEAERKYAEAAQTFETELARLKPTEFYYEELLFDLARVQELGGKKDAAIATYRRILKDVPKSVRAAEIRSQLAFLGATP